MVGKTRIKSFSRTCDSHSSLKEGGHVVAKLLFGKLDSSVPTLLSKIDDFSLFSGLKNQLGKVRGSTAFHILLQEICTHLGGWLFFFFPPPTLPEHNEALRYLVFSVSHHGKQSLFFFTIN